MDAFRGCLNEQPFTSIPHTSRDPVGADDVCFDGRARDRARPAEVETHVISRHTMTASVERYSASTLQAMGAFVTRRRCGPRSGRRRYQLGHVWPAGDLSWTPISPTADGIAGAGMPSTPSRATARSRVSRISRTIRRAIHRLFGSVDRWFAPVRRRQRQPGDEDHSAVLRRAVRRPHAR